MSARERRLVNYCQPVLTVTAMSARERLKQPAQLYEKQCHRCHYGRSR